MLKKSTIQLLRFHFSFFLMPVYWFALSQIVYKNWPRAILVFVILHLLVYPASNGYNSYMDRDESSIGGLKKPLQPTKELFYTTVVMDIIAILLGLLISIYFAVGLLSFILASRAYSYRGIRLKKYPILGYVTVIFFQGAISFLLVYHGSSMPAPFHVPKDIIMAMVASSLLIGGFYPLTQIYQHEEDLKDGVKTISYLLGIKGTFIYVAIVYTIAMMALGLYFFVSFEVKEFFFLATIMLPVVAFFLGWAKSVWKDKAKADFVHTMRMNLIASVCSNIGFIAVMLLNDLQK